MSKPPLERRSPALLSRPKEGEEAADYAADGAAYDASATMKAWESFLDRGRAVAPGGLVRGVIERSWQRSAVSGVDPRGRGSDFIVSPDEVDGLRRHHGGLLQAAGKTFERLADILGETATMVVVTDNRGVIIDTAGDPHIVDAAHDIRLEIGANWGETVTGTNGIGTALVTGKPVYVRAAEHFCEGVKSWTCIGAPIRNPLDGSVIGVVDFSGPQDIFRRHNIALGVMAASHIELALADQLRIERMHLLELCLSRLQGAGRGDGYVILDRHGRVVHHSDMAAARWRQINPGGELRLGEQLVDFKGGTWPDNIADVPGIDTRRMEPLVQDGTFSGAVLLLGPAGHPAPAVRASAGAARLARTAARKAIIGESAVLLEAVERAERAAQGRSTILLEGETGVGKELFAKLIHAAGLHTGKEPFVTFNCGAVSRELLGGELFGHAPGAFTGATREGRAGRFEIADGGVLSLDEIGEMPLDLQPYLLRILEESAVYRLGEGRPRPINVRLVASTNRNLKAEAAEGRFRKDLYFRIGAVKITIPPLRNRHGDIGLLIHHFNRQIADAHGTEPLRFRSAVLDLLERYEWPGNVRELRNLVESMSLMAVDRTVELHDLPEDFVEDAVRLHDPGGGPAGTGDGDDEVARIDDAERRLIERTLAASGGNTSVAADRLGISRSTLYRKLQQYRARH
ncbi:sigma-54-dependent Fis family transcriptional regulator [Ancylobacter lacus]|uniref:sigma-54-dependent Fis family transcriptional regulator n=1 Tax=Ancylobacter lacus TaxID=2579970 RepID=UPI001FE4AD39|nr:sigma-54-dependent Fis family transcriptional regulator [Ancylobacter lacus]